MIFLQLIACGDDGVQEEITPPDPASNIYQGIAWQKDAMPLIAIQENSLLPDSIAFYEQELAHLDILSPLTTRTLSTPTNIPTTFTEYSFTYASPTPQPVYALTSGHLYYVKSGQSHPTLIEGTVADEDMLVLKPLPTMLEKVWPKSQPENVPLLAACVYLNLSLLPDADLKELIRTSKTEGYFKKLYKQKRGQAYSGANAWDDEYLQLFKELPEVPLVVQGGRQIGTTLQNTPTDTNQRLTLLFKLGTWTGHDDDVLAFFKYHQRRLALAGHSMISKMLGHSAQTGSIYLINSSANNGYRVKSTLYDDFKHQLTNPRVYHPLALDPDQHPHRVIVPIVPGSLSWPSTKLALPSDHDVAKIKIYNPLGLNVTIEGADPNHVTIAPLNFTATEQIVEFRSINPVGDETVSIKANNEIAHELTLTFLNFHAVPVTFYKLSDSDPSHVTNMSEPRLLQVLEIANMILGQQTNVYLYSTENNGVALHPLQYNQAFGDPIIDNWSLNLYGADEIWDTLTPGAPKEKLQVVFVWDYDGDNAVGSTFRPQGFGGDAAYNKMIILIDTVQQTGFSAQDDNIAQTLIHEVGHWFSWVFIRWAPSPPQDCAGDDKHFFHITCPGGNWEFYSNLMTPIGSEATFITQEQASVFNSHASGVIP